MPIRGCPQSAPSAVFRKIEQMMRSDGTLNRIVSDWQTYQQGSPGDMTPPTRDVVGLSLFPMLGTEGMESPDSRIQSLSVVVTMTLNLDDAADYMDLWVAVIRSLWPADTATRNANIKALQQVGAECGELKFIPPRPVQSQAVDSAYFSAAGQVVVRVRIQ